MVPKMVRHQEDSNADGSSSYSSTSYVSQGSYIKTDQSLLSNRQSDLYADVFGGVADDNNNIRREDQEANNKLLAKLSNHPAEAGMLTRRHKQLGEAATIGRAIRNKLDTIGFLGNVTKSTVSGIMDAAALIKDVGVLELWYGDMPGSSLGGSQEIPYEPKPYTLDTSIPQHFLAPLKNASFPFRFAATLAVSQALKKGHDRWQPEYFTGLTHRRKDIALLAEKFRRDSAEAADARAGNAAGMVMIQEYGEGGRLFLEKLMNEVDRSAYNYMLALEHKPPMFMQADKQLAESGATSESLQLLFARLEEANFINTFGKDKQPIVEEWTPNAAAYPGAGRLLVAKNPSKNNVQSSSRARHDENAKVDFDSIEHWDYSPDLNKTLEDLERTMALNAKDNWNLFKSDLSAAKKGNIDKMLILANLCEAGHLGIPKGAQASRIAKQLFTFAAEKGNAEAQFRLGRLLADIRFTGQAGLRNDHAAVEWLSKAVEQGHPEAKAKLGMMHVTDSSGLDANKAARAQVLFEEAVKAGVRQPHVLFALARLYHEGWIKASTDEERLAIAMKWYVAAAEEGYAKAQRELGLEHLKKDNPLLASWYVDGRKGANDTDAAKYLQMAAEQNDLEALYYLGEMYHDKRADIDGFVKEKAGTDRIKAAAYCIKRAADGGYDKAQFKLGLMLVNGEIGTKDGEPDYEEAARRFAGAAAQGHIGAMCELAKLYVDGLARPEGEKSPDEAAAELYQEAAKRGSMVAQLALVDLYEAGRAIEPGPKANQEIAKYLELAASHEEADPRIAYKLAELYARHTPGLETGRKGDKLAIKWYAHAANKGLADASYKLAHMYLEKGRVDDLTDQKRVALAEEWYIKAVDAGHVLAQRELGLLHFNRIPGLKGTGKTKGANDADAARYLCLAAEQNDLESISVLGEMYLGERSSVDGLSPEEAAADCFKRAADGGFKEAQYQLGLMLVSGKTGTKDGKPNYEEAAHRFAEAIKQGHREAKCYLAKLFEGKLASPEDGRSPDAAAEDLYEQAANEGSLIAQLVLINLYETKVKQGIEHGPAIDKKIAKYLTLAAKNEEGENQYKNDAQYKLALRHLKNLDTLPVGAEADYKAAEAFELLTLAAKQKHPAACYALGYWHEKPRLGLPKQPDLAKAVELYRVAIEKKKIAAAQYQLGQLYRTGKAVPEGVNEQDVRAVKSVAKNLLMQASQQGHVHARFYHGLMLKEEGNENARLGHKLMVEAAGQGDPDLQFMLAEHLLGHKPDATKKLTQDGIEWLEEAVNQGHKQALQRLGRLCIDGLLSEDQIERSWDYFQKAADEKKDTDSMRMLGWMSEAGLGLEKPNYIQAFAYYKQVVKNDGSDGYSLFRLGALTEAGHNNYLDKGEIAKRKAFELYTQSADKGNAQAKAALDRMREQDPGLPKDASTDEEAVRQKTAATEKEAQKTQKASTSLNDSRKTQTYTYGNVVIEDSDSDTSPKREAVHQRATTAAKGKQKVEGTSIPLNASQKAQSINDDHIEIETIYDSDTDSENDVQKVQIEPTQKGRIDVLESVGVKLHFNDGVSLSETRNYKNGEFVSGARLIDKRATRR